MNSLIQLAERLLVHVEAAAEREGLPPPLEAQLLREALDESVGSSVIMDEPLPRGTVARLVMELGHPGIDQRHARSMLLAHDEAMRRLVAG